MHERAVFPGPSRGTVRLVVQHLTRYQVWNVDSPHFPGAHGRSLHGHTICEADRAAVDAARAELAAAARFEDD
ncbi:hypothetical protein AB0K00_52415 [Dactylosporangium sp. NPDC049525]|uniref:hypothetical protein n=1 Tax=Dactylosporangium sp. NPDC049525 TaxID=3154730 RepID=UPI0034498B30